MVWAIDFQFDSTVDGKAIKIASMIDEHTRCSLLHVVERSITAERLVVEMKDRLKGWVSHDLFSPAEITLPAQESQLRAPDASEEAASALVALGYKPQQASQIVAKVASEGMSVEAIIRESLRSLV